MQNQNLNQSVSSINSCRQAAQQIIQQTQQSNHQYQQLLQNEQQNVQMLDQLMQRERMTVQTIQHSLQGHEMAIQRCQEVIAECNRIEQSLSSQIPSTGYQQQTYVTPAYQSTMFHGNTTSQYRQ